jgi:hypothetical protein
MTNAAQEAAKVAERLRAQVEEALVGVNRGTADDAGELETAADRIERLARDLSVALRDLASRRRARKDET